MFQFFKNMVEPEKKKKLLMNAGLRSYWIFPSGSKPACLKTEVREFKYLEIHIVDMVLATL